MEKNIKFIIEQDNDTKEIFFGISGKNLVFNTNNFFDITAVITFIPYDSVNELAVALSQVAEDIQRNKDLKDGKAGEELREMSKEELERVE